MKKVISGVLALAAFCVFGLVAPQPVRAAATTQSVAFPMYEYPTIGTLWDDIFSAGSQVPWIIANPGNGPGASVDSNYTTYLNNKPASQRAVGYVYTSYNVRDIAEVIQDIDDWYVMYPQIGGIFVDLLKNGGAASDVCYAATLHNYVKSKHASDLVVMNPGSNIEAAYEPYGDIFANAENTYAVYSSWTPYTDGFENNAAYASRFWHIVHTTNAGDVAGALALTRTNNAGWVLVTDGGLPNPYTAVPSYWSSFLTSVASLPQTQIPNRGLTALPAGCLDLSLATSRTTTTQTKQVTNTITNAVANTDTTRFSPGTTTVTYTVPSGATLTGLSGSGWSCSTASRTCTNGTTIAANTALADITANVAVGCSYTSGSVGITLRNFANNSATVDASVVKPSDCADAASGESGDSTAGTISSTSSRSSRIATVTTQTPEATPSEPVQEPTVTTAPESDESNQFTPTQNTDDESAEPVQSAAFDVVPLAIGGGAVLLIALIGGVGWWLWRRGQTNLPY